MNIPTGLAPSNMHEQGRHFVMFYDTDRYLADEVADFIGSGLNNGDGGIVIATAAHHEYLQRRLQSHFNSRGLPSRQYVRLDAEETLSRFMVNGWPEEKRFFHVLTDILQQVPAPRSGRIRVFGEMVALLWADGKKDAAIRLERLWDELAQKMSFTLFCAYPISSFASSDDDHPFREVCGAHTHVFPAEGCTEAGDHNDLLRNIADLQQKAHALETEVTARQEMQRLLHQRDRELSDFLENAAEGLHRMDASGIILWANRAELQMLGYETGEYIGHHISEFHADPEVLEAYLHKLQLGQTVYDQRVRMRCKDGSIRHIVVHANALMVDGEMVYTRCFSRDISDRVLLEKQLEERLRQLAETDQRKDEFLAMLGHELRNPLAPITTSLALMRLQAEKPDVVTRCREVIERQIALLKRLVDDLLDVSRITLGKLELKIETVRLQSVIEQALEQVRPLIDQLGHQLTVDIPDEPITLPADPDRLAQVLANLLNNAAKYTPPGGKILLSSCIKGCELRLSVRDNGSGLTEEMRDRIFGLFMQGGSPLDHARGGLGVGLSLARTIVELHGGSIEVFSDGPGSGSEFLVRLPRHIQTTRAPAAVRPARNASAGNQAKRIMLVDDYVDAAESLADLLKLAGHEVHIAHDGYTALQIAARVRPEVIILDIGMPAMDGYELAKRLRTNRHLHRALLIALTGYSSCHDPGCAQLADFDLHFCKPVDLQQLTDVIQWAGSGTLPA